jgi:CP family cyanate transporter-like MFS transporter
MCAPLTEKKRFLLLIAVFTLATASMRPSTTSFSPLLETIRTDLLISNTIVSLLAVIPILCNSLSALFASRIGVRWEPQQVIAVCLLTISAGTALRFVAHSPGLLMLTTVIVGIGTAIASPMFSGFVKKNFPRHMAIATGFYTLGIGIGASLGTGLTVPIQQMMNASWSVGLGVWFLFPFIGLLVWYPIVRRFASHAANRIAAPHPGRLPWRLPDARLAAAVYGLQGCTHFIVATWLAPIAQYRGFGVYAAGMVLTGYMIVQMICSFLISWAAQRTGNRFFWLLLSSCLMTLGVLPLMLLHSAMAPWLAAVLFGAGSGGLFTMGLLMPLDLTNSPEEASVWTALLQLSSSFLSALGPVLIGAIRDYTGGFESAYVALLVICVIQMAVVLRVRKLRKDGVRVNP